MGQGVGSVFKDITSEGNQWSEESVHVPSAGAFQRALPSQPAFREGWVPTYLVAPITSDGRLGEETFERSVEDVEDQRLRSGSLLTVEDFLTDASRLQDEAVNGPRFEFQGQFEQMVLHATPMNTNTAEHGFRPKSKNSWAPLSKVRALERDGVLLTERRLRELHPYMPVSMRMANCWKLIYCPVVHGVSLQTFFRQCQRWPGETLMIVKDHKNVVFGGFASHMWRASYTDTHYGAPDCFVFSFGDPDKEAEDPAPSVHPWAGGSQNFMFADSTGFGMGGGKGYAFWVTKDLLHGSSSPSATFGTTAPIASQTDYVIRTLECWTFDQSAHQDMESAMGMEPVVAAPSPRGGYTSGSPTEGSPTEGSPCMSPSSSPQASPRGASPSSSPKASVEGSPGRKRFGDFFRRRATSNVSDSSPGFAMRRFREQIVEATRVEAFNHYS